MEPISRSDRSEAWDLIPDYCAVWVRSVDTRARRSPPHVARHHHLLFFAQANQMISIGERMLSLEDGCVVVVPEGSEYTFSYGTQCHYYCLSFRPPKGAGSPLLSEMLHRRSSLLRTRDTEQRSHLLHQIKQLHDHLQKPREIPAIPKNAYRDACFAKIIMDVYALQAETAWDAYLSERERLAERIRGYLDQHCLSPINLSDLEKSFFTSRYQLCRLFREQMRTTIFDYLRTQRIEHAKRLLLSSSKNITAICFESGFNNLQSFYNAFRRRVGKTPLQYRKELLDK